MSLDSDTNVASEGGNTTADPNGSKKRKQAIVERPPATTGLWGYPFPTPYAEAATRVKGNTYNDVYAALRLDVAAAIKARYIDDVPEPPARASEVKSLEPVRIVARRASATRHNPPLPGVLIAAGGGFRPAHAAHHIR